MGFCPQELLDLGIKSQNFLLLLVYFEKMRILTLLDLSWFSPKVPIFLLIFPLKLLFKSREDKSRGVGGHRE